MLHLFLLSLQPDHAANSTLENALATSSSSSDAAPPVVTQASSHTSSDVLVPTSGTVDSEVRVATDKHSVSAGISKSNQGSIHVVVDDRTLSSRVVRTMVSFTKASRKHLIKIVIIKLHSNGE